MNRCPNCGYRKIAKGEATKMRIDKILPKIFAQLDAGFSIAEIARQENIGRNLISKRLKERNGSFWQ
jgi:hypothetical protein